MDHVYAGFRTPDAPPLGDVDAPEIRTLVEAGAVPAGSMGPKVEAVVGFLDRNPTGRTVITSPERLIDALAGRAGTRGDGLLHPGGAVLLTAGTSIGPEPLEGLLSRGS